MDTVSNEFSQYSEPLQKSSEYHQTTNSHQQFPFHYMHQLQQPYPYPYQSSSQISQSLAHPYTPQYEVSTQQLEQPQLEKSRSKKQRKSKVASDSTKKRLGNFSSKEDMALVKSWIGVSGDGIIGNSQSRTSLWDRIYTMFMEILCHGQTNSDGERTPNSLACRWQIIQQQVNKFCGYFATIDRNPRSGTNYDDWVEDAKKVFRACEGFDFKMEELWKILRDVPKFNEKHVVPKRKKNMEVPPTQNSDVFSHNVEPIGIDDTLEQPTSTLERSPVHQDLGGEKDNTFTYKDGVQRPEMGRKKSKEKRRNEVTSQGTSKLLKEFISNFDASMKQQFSLSEKEIKSKEDMVRKDHELKERHLKQKEEELHQQAQQMKLTKWLAEKDILEKDLAGMTHPQAELFRKIQHDILEKWMIDSTVP